jgi:hypothetical protein
MLVPAGLYIPYRPAMPFNKLFDTQIAKIICQGNRVYMGEGSRRGGGGNLCKLL